MVLLFLTAVFLIVLVLIQRGKGGGLAGALGGMGGQSAFGTKAGDLFTKITIGVAAFWIILCLAAGKGLTPPQGETRKGVRAPRRRNKKIKPPAPATGKAPAKSPDSTPARKSNCRGRGRPGSQ